MTFTALGRSGSVRPPSSWKWRTMITRMLMVAYKSPPKMLSAFQGRLALVMSLGKILLLKVMQTT